MRERGLTFVITLPEPARRKGLCPSLSVASENNKTTRSIDEGSVAVRMKALTASHEVSSDAFTPRRYLIPIPPHHQRKGAFTLLRLQVFEAPSENASRFPTLVQT